MKCTMCLSRDRVTEVGGFFACAECFAALKETGLVSDDGVWVGRQKVADAI